MTTKNHSGEQIKNKWIKPLLSLSKWPLLAIIIMLIIYSSGTYFSHTIFSGFKEEIIAILTLLLKITIPVSIYWFFLNIINYAQVQIEIYLKNTDHKNLFSVLSFLMNALKIIIILSLLSFIINLLPLPAQYNYFTEKLLSILIITAITSIFIRLVKLAEELIAIKYNIDKREDLLAHKARTQIIVIGRIVTTLIVVIAIGAVLILFESVRNLGTSILTSAGILTLISGLAIQGPLKNLVESLQIIFNQLIKINDLVTVEKETGTIEEINFSYVVVKTWDRRRLILPTNYFITNPFINLSLKSTETLGIIKIFADYTLPVEEVRTALKNIVSNSLFWDKEVCKLHVSDLKEAVIELRIDVSSKTPGDSWDLQCEIREKLIYFIQKNYPASLPLSRVDLRTEAKI